METTHSIDAARLELLLTQAPRFRDSVGESVKNTIDRLLLFLLGSLSKNREQGRDDRRTA